MFWKLIPEYPTCSQCFSIYAAVVIEDQPERAADLMAYSYLIATSFRRYRWPSWLIYDQNFRQEVAGDLSKTWGKVDPSTVQL